MIKLFARLISPLLENALVLRVRRNHALEHATIHMLNRQHYRLSGRASLRGFVVIGDVPTDKVESAAREALKRLQKGESKLAIHPNCGTNLVTAGLITTSIAAVGFTNTNRKSAWERFPMVMVLMMIAALYSQPIGMVVQEYITTSGDPGTMEIVTVKRSSMRLPFRKNGIQVHQIMTHNG
ncbi:MAG: DUF6391 domain-containing protein [Anaerolineae bacterium]|nr:DUF6391 domain-containing protein [Anaerolineae bacterium]MDQ7034500.1 DUF6391 domain-containing protein [Anaerolineae bacterium]